MRPRVYTTCIALLFSLAVCVFSQNPDQSSTASAKADNSDVYTGPVFKTVRGLSVPRLIYQSDPQYSKKAREKKLQGTCLLSIVVDPEGNTRNIQIQRGLGMGLDEEAIKAVKAWKFKPALKDGQPVAVQLTVEVNFHLD